MKEFTLKCLRCGFFRITAWREVVDLDCPNCQLPLSALYLAGHFCRECTFAKKQDGKFETFTVSDDRLGTFTFSVARARQLAHESGLTPGEVPDWQVAKFLQINITEPRHYPHVDRTAPGLVAEVELTDSLATYTLLDGSHRAAVAFEKREPFLAYLLPWNVAQQALLEHVPGEITKE